jgi:hypothetical protein
MIYEASHIKRRRATKADVNTRRARLLEIVAEMKPMTVRQVFYQATVRDWVEKSDPGYNKVQTDLVQMRRAGVLPYDWLADNTRWQRKPRTFNGVQQALEDTARLYRKDLWADADAYVSLSFLHNAATFINDLRVPTFIYHCGDYDPSGVNAAEKIEQTLREMAPNAEISFERIAVTPEQITAWSLPSRPTKKSDRRSKNFGAISVELDAIEPNQLRDLIERAIERHLPPVRFAVLKAAERSERELIAGLVGMMGSR